MDVELRHLRYFVAVAEELHFGRAAARLHMAQPPLSQAIRRLEDAVGCPLLLRTSRSVALTPAGAAFLERARRTLRNVESDIDEARSIGEGQTGRLNVGFVGSGMLTTLPRILSRYVADYPGVQLQLHESFTSRVIDGLLAGDVDAGIVRDAEPVGGLVVTPMLSEPFVALVPCDHPQARDASMSVAALADMPFVYPPRSAGARAYEKPLILCEQHGFRPRVAHEASHWLTILRLVGTGLGVSIAPACVRHITTSDVACVPLRETSVVSELELLYRVDEHRPMVHAFGRIATRRTDAPASGRWPDARSALGCGPVSSAPEPWECAYGENAWQAPARLVHQTTDDPLALGRFTLLEGSPLSFNNLVEVDRQLQTITHIAAAFDVAGGVPAIAVGTKHGNACGAAVADIPVTAAQLMLTGDTRAIFGGCVMLNFAVDDAVAEALLHHAAQGRRLLDLVVAPSFTEAAIEALARKQGKCRILANPALGELDHASLDTATLHRPVRGGVLEQPNYTFVLDLSDPAVQRHGTLTTNQERDLLLAWAVGSTSNSNTSTLVRDGQLIGNGVGQQDRVGGCALAISRGRDAGHEITGAVAYSDSFFPFPDGPQVLVDAGVTAIFATTGSIRDDAVRQAVLDAGVAFAQLPDRDARGFFGH